ncbi:hypothetical protein GW17_00060680, partial [Ensete ventricosum]
GPWAVAGLGAFAGATFAGAFAGPETTDAKRERDPGEGPHPLVLPEGGFIPMEEGLIRTFGLTSTVTLGVAESYGEPTGVVVWDEDVCPDASTLDAECVANLAAQTDVISSQISMSSGSLGNQSGPQSSSSGVMVGADAKALQALEAIKSHHDFDSTVSLESLALIRKCFSIPNEYVLHAPGPGQRPYHSCPGGFSTSIDALEVGLRFPLHPVIGESRAPFPTTRVGRRFLFVSRRRGGDFDVEWSAHPISNVPPNLSDEETNLIGQLKDILSASQAIRSLTEEWLIEAGLSPASRGMPYFSTYEFRCLISLLMIGFAEMPPCKVDRATTKGKGLVEVPEEPPASRRKLKSVRELHNASARVDSRDYHAIRMCNLPEKAPDAPLEADLRPLTHEILVWQNRKASTKYIRGTLILRLATDLYTLPYEVLIDGVVKVMVRVITSLDSKVNLLHQEVQNLKEGGDLDTMVAAEVRASEAQSLTEHLRVELDEANDRRVSAEADLEIARAESVNLRRQLTDSREQLDDSEGQLRGARTQVRQMETELLELTRSKDALWEDLPRRAIEDYKKSPGFEMGLVRMGRVSLEYGYQLTLARLQARHPRVEIELDPFASLPEDDDMLMANE